MKVLRLLFICMLATPCAAADLSEFGIDSVTELTETDAKTVRGLGMSTYVDSLSTQSFALSLADKFSGSVINMNANSRMKSYDGSDLYEGSSASSQAVGSVSQGGIQFGDANFEMGEFSFNLSGFQSVAQANQVAGPSGTLDFSSIFGN
ncbi:hypothetical protein OAF09_01745 [bacterium]|nr:hypothetical protein [bacterium]